MGEIRLEEVLLSVSNHNPPSKDATHKVDEDVDLDAAYLDWVTIFVFVLRILVFRLDGGVEILVCNVWGFGG